MVSLARRNSFKLNPNWRQSAPTRSFTFCVASASICPACGAEVVGDELGPQPDFTEDKAVRVGDVEVAIIEMRVAVAGEIEAVSLDVVCIERDRRLDRVLEIRFRIAGEAVEAHALAEILVKRERQLLEGRLKLVEARLTRTSTLSNVPLTRLLVSSTMLRKDHSLRLARAGSAERDRFEILLGAVRFELFE